MYIVGDSVTLEDKEYLEKIKSNIPKQLENNVIFTGSVAFSELSTTYKDMDLAINISDTGSLDKAIIEPMAMGIPIITSNDSARELFDHLDEQGIYLIKHKNDLEFILQKVINENGYFNRTRLSDEIVNNHSLSKLSKKIVDSFM